MIPILYRDNTVDFNTNGIGRLSDTIECIVTEERNGVFELYLKYPVSGIHYDDLEKGNIIGATHDDTGDIQPFDIYRVVKNMDGIKTVYARHISYRLTQLTAIPFTAGSCAEAFVHLPESILPECPFTFWTDKEVATPFTLSAPTSARSVLGGVQGSILDVYGKGEYEWDKWTIKLHLNRGARSGVAIRYGKNLTDLEQDVDEGDIYAGVVPFWNGEGSTLLMLPERVIYKEGVDVTGRLLHVNDAYAFANGAYIQINEERRAKVIPLDLTQSFQERPTAEQLRNAATRYLNNNTPWKPKENIKINFVQLWQTKEFSDVAQLLRLKLCDRVDVYHPVLGITAENIEIIKVAYNVLNDRYDSMELGQPKSSLGSSISAAVTKEIMKTVPTKSSMQQAIDSATALITGGLGGYVVIGRNADGQPNEILIMDTPDMSTAVNVIRINSNGIGFSTTGYNGPFINAWTIDGHLIADFIDTGTLNANIVKAGIISDKQGQNYWNMDTGELRLGSETIVDDPTTLDGTITLGTYQQTTETRLTQTEDGLDLNFTRAMQRISDVDYSQTEEFALWESYIRFVNGAIVIGKSENPLTLTLENDRISFKSSGVEVAYISDNIMYISNIHVTDSAIINGLTVSEISDGYLIDIQAG